MKIKDFIKTINLVAPLSMNEKWDNSGLIVGNLETKVEKVLLGIDITDELLDFAIKNKYNLVLTHHPMIFKNMKKFEINNKRAHYLFKAYENNLNILGWHTPLDLSDMGTHETLSNIINLQNREIIEKIYVESYYKLITFVPKTHIDIVFDAITKAGAGRYNNYDSCTFQQNGLGTFKPLINSNAYIGSVGNIEHVEEIKLESIVLKSNVSNVIAKLKQVHPYEEVAYDIIKLENLKKEYGHGRIGNIKSISAKELAFELKKELGAKCIKIYGDENRKIENIAICAGAGEDLINELNNIDAYISSDIRSTKILDLMDKDMVVIDIGHYYSERPVLKKLKEFLDSNLENILVDISELDMDNESSYTIV